MNNKGFTLIELLITICLLAIISTISVSVIANFNEKSKQNNYQILLDNIYNAAKLYFSDNRYESATEVTLDDLVNDGYLELKDNKLVNPINNEEVTNYQFITIEIKGNTYKFQDIDNGLCVNSLGETHQLCQG